MPQSITQHTKNNLITPATGTRSVATKPQAAHPEPLRGRLGSGGNSSVVLPAAGQYLTIKQIASEMQIGLTSVGRLVKLGRLRAINISTGRRPTYRISLESYEQFKAAGAVESPVVPVVPSGRYAMPDGILEYV